MRVAIASSGAVGALVVATVVLVVNLAGGGVSKAFAGWTANPTAPASGQLEAAEAACQTTNAGLAGLIPTVADIRGPYTQLVYAGAEPGLPASLRVARPGENTQCITGIQGGPFISEAGGHRGTPSPAVGSIEWNGLVIGELDNGQTFSTLVGRVGTGVTAVSLVLQDGDTIETTVANGWVAAWWPSTQGTQSVAITTASGTTTQPLVESLPSTPTQGVSVTTHPSAHT
jgi:hypothetical protein